MVSKRALKRKDTYTYAGDVRVGGTLSIKKDVVKIKPHQISDGHCGGMLEIKITVSSGI